MMAQEEPPVRIFLRNESYSVIGIIMDIIKITDNISYIEAVEKPLSADVVIVQAEDIIWLYDVGSHPLIPSLIRNINIDNKDINVVLSHFHPDHIANLENVEYKNVYQGKYTYKYTHTGIVVEKAVYFDNKKTRIDILPFPSSHSKGSLAMLVDNSYLFVGDALYPKTKGSDKMYNVSILNEQIKLLKNLEITHIMLSHRKPFAMKKEAVIMWLLDIYNKRNKNDAFIME